MGIHLKLVLKKSDIYSVCVALLKNLWKRHVEIESYSKLFIKANNDGGICTEKLYLKLVEEREFH